MRLATYEHEGARHVGVVEGEALRALAGLTELGLETSREMIGRAEPEGDLVPLSAVRLLPPVPNPTKILCVGLNYFSHVHETGRDQPTYPVLFPKFASSLIGPADEIVLPPESAQVDFEAELAVVIGARVRRVAEADALDAVLGYTVANDITMRDYQYKTHQWVQGKAWDSSTPVGPFVVTPDEVDPADLAIRMELNGVEMQSSRTSLLIFSIAKLIATISEFTCLMPGDLILTGTPGGVGYRREPKVLLKPDDQLSVFIEGVGELHNTTRADDRWRPELDQAIALTADPPT